MGQRQVDKMASEHFMVARKIYHWDRDSDGKRQAHLGLGKNCETFKTQQGLE